MAIYDLFSKKWCFKVQTGKEGMIFSWRESMREVPRYSTSPIQYFLDGLFVLTREYHLNLLDFSIEMSFSILVILGVINICMRQSDLTTCIVKI